MLLSAGQFSVSYENGFLRYINLAGKEVVRMIYFAVRDRDWNTIPGVISNVDIKQSENEFSIQYQFEVKAGDIQMQWQVEIAGLPESIITFEIRGKVLHTFLRNRLGLSVLHPIEGLTGKPCLIGHPDGSTTEAYFPAYISPYQPFKNICFMQWKSGETATLQLYFEGDIFETEDHRNWTDSSYKTYCTPLELPFPVEVQAGIEIQQKCTLRLVDSDVKIENVPQDNSVLIQLSKQKTAFPDIGLGMNQEVQELTEGESLFLKSLNLSHLRADIFLTQADWQLVLKKAIHQCTLLQVPLEIALFFGDNPGGEVIQLLASLALYTVTVKHILVFDTISRLTSTHLLNKVVPAIRLALPYCKIGGGTDASFAELNRNKFDYDLIDFVSFSANPQVHAFDDLTLLENMSAQADVVHSARKLTAGKPIHVSPITLKPRFNAVATSGSSGFAPPVDSRQATNFIAGWTLGSLKYLSEAGVTAVTYFENTGSRGICSGDKIFPVGKLFDYIQKLAPQKVLQSRISQPLQVSSLLLESEKGKYLLLANHTPAQQVIRLADGMHIKHVTDIIDNTPDRNIAGKNSYSLSPLKIVSLALQNS